MFGLRKNDTATINCLYEVPPNEKGNGCQLHTRKNEEFLSLWGISIFPLTLLKGSIRIKRQLKRCTYLRRKCNACKLIIMVKSITQLVKQMERHIGLDQKRSKTLRDRVTLTSLYSQ